MGNDVKYLIVGEILRPHGVRGELRMRVLTDYPERLSKHDSVFLGQSPNKKLRQYTLEHVRMHKAYALLTLDGIADRDDADKLRGLKVMIDVNNAIPLEDDEIYLFQLIGMQVNNEAGDVLGTVKEVIETGANDVYVLNSEKFGEILIPITPETLLNTDTETGIILVRLPDGLLPE